MKTLLKRARIALLLVILAILLCSCKTRYIPVETIRLDTAYISKVKHDSIHTSDSIYVFIKGDTVIKYKYKYTYTFKEIHDTLWREKVDTIQIPYPIEAQLTEWQKAKMSLGSVAFFILIIELIIFISKSYLRRKQ